TDSLKTAVKVMGAVLVGSACPAAWLIVTVGGVGSKVTVLSVLVEAVFPVRAATVLNSSEQVTTTAASGVSPLAAPVLVLGPPVISYVVVPPAVPHSIPTRRSSDLTDSLKTAVKVMGAVLVGSACPAAWLIVTVGGVGSNVTVLSVLVEAVF